VVCPTCAIDGGWDRTNNIEEGKATIKRYIEELKKAEARGEFRWYIDPNIINLEDNQFKQKKRKLNESKDL
jgi:hypothetical protein